ncbi:MAG: CsgE family curli-type amyloid fiber assembly protein [Bacteroidia bacterium]|nr:CsgE family curli-type amyloid fiber assembly protein [Bacteroidia bacterium]
MRLRVLLVLFLLTWSVVAWAQKDVEIEGLVIDQTRTRIGHDFYREFVTFWESAAPSDVKGYNITIFEMSSPLWGSNIKIEVNMVAVHRVILRPRTEDVKETAKKGVLAVREYLVSQEVSEKFLKGGDLLDLSGDGVF